MTGDWEDPPPTSRRGLLVGVLAVAVVVLLAGRVTTDDADEPLPAATPTPEPTVSSSAGIGSWRTLAGAPLRPRAEHLAVWSGREMIVWGGVTLEGRPLTDGAAYDPDADTWRRVPPWWGHIGWPVLALWAGEEMVVVGEQAIAAYHPEHDRWRWLPSPPEGDWAWQSAGFAGGELVVLARSADGESPRRAVAHLPGTDAWRELPEPPLDGWEGSSSVAIGGDLAVAGLREGSVALTRYLPAQQRWAPVGRAPWTPGWPPSLTAARNHVIVAGLPGLWRWTGGSWLELPAPPQRLRETPDLSLHWRDGDLVAWADDVPGGVMAGGRWHEMRPPPLARRQGAASVWTGEELIVWGGGTHEGQFGDGAAFRHD